MFNITIRVTIGDTRYEDMPPVGERGEMLRFDDLTTEYVSGEINLLLPFIPQIGMHFATDGESQFITVCQVYWTGNNNFVVDTRHISCVDFNVSMAVNQEHRSKRSGHDEDDYDNPITRRYADVHAAIDEVQNTFQWQDVFVLSEPGTQWRWKQIQGEFF